MGFDTNDFQKPDTVLSQGLSVKRLIIEGWPWEQDRPPTTPVYVTQIDDFDIETWASNGCPSR
jgi:hypothetical protein